MLYQTLHAHTTLSDGKMDYLEVLEVCKKNNIGVVAFTDHDSLPTEQTINRLTKSSSNEVDWIIGTELSSGWPIDLGGGATGNLHIVGLFVDPSGSKLREHCKMVVAARIERMKSMVKNLNNIGIVVSEDDCLNESKGEAVGRPHIVAAINKHAENKAVILRIKEQLRKDAETDLKLKSLYDEILNETEERYPYRLFLGSNSYIKNVYVDYKYITDLDTTVTLIRNAGGMAFLAHWYTAKDKLTADILETWIRDNRIDGCESVCGLWSGDPQPREIIDKDYIVLSEMLKKYNRFESGGCDAHSEADYKIFNENEWYAKRTIGMAEKIITGGKVDVTMSSFK